MGNACARCGGIGYGHHEPEVGHVGSEPCPDCSAQFKKAHARKKIKPTYGPSPKPLPRERKATVTMVDGGTSSASAEDLGQSAEEVGFSPEAIRQSGGGKRLR